MNFRNILDDPVIPMSVEAVLEFNNVVVERDIDENSYYNLVYCKKLRPYIIKIVYSGFTCRETLIRRFGEQINYYRKNKPNFSKRKSNLLFSTKKGKPINPVSVETFHKILYKLCGVTLGKIFPGSVDKIRITEATRMLPVFGGYGTKVHFVKEKALLVRFPNLYLSNPGVMSLFLSIARKSIRFTNSNAKTAANIREYLVDCLEDETDLMLERINVGHRDPFFPGHRVIYYPEKSYSFPVDLFHFVLENHIGDLQKVMWGNTTISGWQDFIMYLYKKKSYESQFIRFLVKKYPDKTGKIGKIFGYKRKQRRQ